MRPGEQRDSIWPRKAALVRLARRLLRIVALGALVLIGLVGLVVVLLQRPPRTYPLAANPIPPPVVSARAGLLDGFDSPYLGHTGSWNGRGGAWGGSKIGDLDKEKAMGLRWTFMAVYWRALEPDGPVNLEENIPEAWRELDEFVVAAHARGLNILMQAPVVGGNAGGPPEWAGRRKLGKSAPANMVALANFAGKLARRYCPGGVLALREGWGTNYGVRAWELDNEPESYLTCWKGQAGDYAEFVATASARIKAADPLAVIVGPGMAGGKDGADWLAAVLDPDTGDRSFASEASGGRFSAGSSLDVISFHNYEGLDSLFNGGPRTVVQVFEDVRAVLESHETSAGPFGYARKRDYWHTEGNYDFIGVMPAERRAAWRFQFFTRAFSAGIRKVCVMDASPAEQLAIRAYVSVLPDPFPMLPTTNEVLVSSGRIAAFRHADGPSAAAGRVWVIWPLAATGDAVVDVPVIRSRATVVRVSGKSGSVEASRGYVRVNLPGDLKMAAGVLVEDR